MSISLKDLITNVAKDGIRAQQSVKTENALFFETLFERTDEGYKPREFMLDLLKHDVGLPLINMMDQDHFAVKRLKVSFDTEASLTTNDKDEIIVDCTLRTGLQKSNTNLSIEMELESGDSTEGIEQIRAYLADRLSSDLTKAKNERIKSDGD